VEHDMINLRLSVVGRCRSGICIALNLLGTSCGVEPSAGRLSLASTMICRQ